MRKLFGYCVIAIAAFVSSSAYSAEVNVYSARKEALIKPVLDNFSQETGIKVNLITGSADALISRIDSEGKYSPADILLTTDAGRLVRAKQQGLTQAFTSETIDKQVAPALRDQEGHWFALTKRARPIMVAKSNSTLEGLSSYEDLTNPEFKGQICIRSSSNIYNQSMLAALIHLEGEAAASKYATGLVKNFARPPKGGDRDQIKAMVAGQCSVAIANTYYLAGMLKSSDPAEVSVAEQVRVIWPNQQGRGAHVNISGAALIKNAPNPEEAKQLLDYLLNEKSQAWYAEANFEYPVREDVQWSKTLKGFGEFKAESVPLERVGELNAEALKVMDKAGWK
ncbi:Fe(3+) ABC transporter substrate-binding protein [Aliiglaciecola sp. LCG003]|uniref:Fe(3+) ABC transporter substrate-binding protein n=1 Tax=Aliiglaciecola sp. LCG003 TaxID=3053655 RepID=UPI002573951B|nr:Fe(3+) ABC transporter substrate-binding protein [Aliiglaciecola sp. LCG003]WJG08125.1 Fe(3+) ABC transporter substrate-binding protein [Aliiglaciecola sp. LCG003]